MASAATSRHRGPFRTRAGGKRAGRFDAHWTAEQRDLIEHAAALVGQPVSQFVLNAAQQTAIEMISKHRIIVLSVRDSRMVMEALQHPEPAGPALQRADERYRALIGDDE